MKTSDENRSTRCLRARAGRTVPWPFCRSDQVDCCWIFECTDLERTNRSNFWPSGGSWAKEMLVKFLFGFLSSRIVSCPGRLQQKEKVSELKPVASYGRPRTSAGWGVTYRRLHVRTNLSQIDRQDASRSGRGIADRRWDVCLCSMLVVCTRVWFFAVETRILPTMILRICRRNLSNRTTS